MEHSFGTERVTSLIFRLAPPVMAAQLIQALYNIVDSFFIGRYSESGLTALSVIFPIQLLIQAVGIGTGVGVNTLISRYNGENRQEKARNISKCGSTISLVSWLVFAIASCVIMKQYLSVSSASADVRCEAAVYGYIVCIGSIGIFMESMWTKILQAKGDMKTPMLAQISGAALNIIADPILIFGWFGFPEMGVGGAAVASILGQLLAAAIVAKRGFSGIGRITAEHLKIIYKTGFPSIIMQSLYTVYIIGLNLILGTFSDAAVTVLGLYYKLQTFFFIPLFALEICIVPILSYNYAAAMFDRCRKTLEVYMVIAVAFMTLATILFEFVPGVFITFFADDAETVHLGIPAFRIIGLSFLPGIASSLLPVYFQAVLKGRESIALTVLRQIVLLVPIAFLLSRFGLIYVWFTFPISELVTSAVGWFLIKKDFAVNYKR